MPEALAAVRAALERHLMARWYGGVAPGLVLRALAGIYGTLMRVRRGLYRRGLLRQHRLPVPVIVVGNRTVGGAGKTPLVIALVEAMRARGWRPGVVSRGHGREARGLLRVQAASTPEATGDEPLLVHRATGVPVVVDADRVTGALHLVEAGCDLVIADDGLQHLRLGRSLDIEVQDGRGLGNARVMPAGPLREPLPARSEALRVVHGRPVVAGETPMHLTLGDAVAIDAGDASVARPLAAFRGRRVHAVAGIGDPARFFAALRAIGLDLVEHPFPDHHPYVAGDFAALGDAPVLMTGKDAVKCRGLGLVDAWEVPVHALLPEAFLQQLHDRLRENPHHVDP